jgi:hypothetical protein
VEVSLGKENETTNAASRVRVALWVHSILILAVTGVSWAIYWHHRFFELRPFLAKIDQYQDLLNYMRKTAHLHNGAMTLGQGMPVFNYPAPAAFVYKLLLYAFPGHPVRPYLCFLAVCIVGFAVVAWGATSASRGVGLSATAAISVTALIGFPLWFVVDRGNIEGVAWAISAAGLCFLLRGKLRAGAVLIGLGACVKPFCILFLLLLLRRRKYKEAALGVITAGVVVVAAMTALGPNPWRAYQELKPGVSQYVDIYVMNLAQVDEARFLHSLLDGMKSGALTVEMGGIRPHKAVEEVPKLMAEPGGWHEVRPLVHAYPLVAIIGFGSLLSVFYEKPMLNQLTALGVAVTLFPPSAGEYTLLHLYVPFGALVVFLAREAAAGKVVLRYSSMFALVVIYALLFSPLTFLMLYAGDAKLLLLLGLLFVMGRTPMPSGYFGDPAEFDANEASRPAVLLTSNGR